MLRGELSNQFSDAAIGIGSWYNALESFASYTGSMRGQLIGIGGPNSIPFNMVTNVSDDALNEFVDIDGGSPLINPRVAASIHAQTMEVVGDREYDAVTPHLKTQDYIDYNHKWDMPFGCQTTILNENGLLIGAAVLRSSADGRTDEVALARFAQIAPEILKSVRLTMALDSQGTALVANSLELMTIPALICDSMGKVCALTASAEAQIISNSEIDLERGELKLKNPILQSKLIGSFTKVALWQGQQEISVRSNNEAKPPFIIKINPLPKAAWNFGFVPKFLISLHFENKLPRLENIQSTYGLSYTEASVALYIAMGQSRDQIARKRGVSDDTIRTQLKIIYSKLGINREAELILKILAIG